jgi:hypothetical protein
MDVRPDIICVNESWLDKSVKSVKLEGYASVARRDRRDGRKCGGILVFVDELVAPAVTLLEDSQQYGRSWLMIHTNTGPQLLGLWYRPPDSSEVGSIKSLPEEIAPLRASTVGTTIIGDLNIHQRQWLLHSARNSVEGLAFQTKCRDLGLHKIVRKPSRENYLLDLALTDVMSARAAVIIAIADHRMVLLTFDFSAPRSTVCPRQVWQFQEADWDLLSEKLGSISWEPLATRTASEGATLLTNVILDCAAEAIPMREVSAKTSTHPWMNDTAIAAVARKLSAAGTPDERTVSIDSSLIDVLVSWLKQRQTKVVIGGSSSDSMDLNDMVFQGTVLGPILWNLFFGDARRAIIAAFLL